VYVINHTSLHTCKQSLKGVISVIRLVGWPIIGLSTSNNKSLWGKLLLLVFAIEVKIEMSSASSVDVQDTIFHAQSILPFNFVIMWLSGYN